MVPGSGAGDRDGNVTVEGGGLLQARNLALQAQTVTVDHAGRIVLDGKGITTGLGRPLGTTQRSGAGYGGKGGIGTPRM